MVDAVDLVLAEQGGDVVGQLVGALQVLPEGLLHNDAVPASAGAQRCVTPTPSLGSWGQNLHLPSNLSSGSRDRSGLGTRGGAGGGDIKDTVISVGFKMGKSPFLC